ncbi:hypothetical protein D3C81_1783860 [compost metagenome]
MFSRIGAHLSVNSHCIRPFGPFSSSITLMQSSAVGRMPSGSTQSMAWTMALSLCTRIWALSKPFSQAIRQLP